VASCKYVATFVSDSSDAGPDQIGNLSFGHHVDTAHKWRLLGTDSFLSAKLANDVANDDSAYYKSYSRLLYHLFGREGLLNTGAMYASNRHRNEAGINRNHNTMKWTATNGKSLLTTRRQQTSIEPIHAPVHDEIRNTFNKALSTSPFSMRPPPESP
jgi:hypothetical protein